MCCVFAFLLSDSMEQAPRALQSLTGGRTLHQRTSIVCLVGEDVITNDETIEQHAIARTGIEANAFVGAYVRSAVPLEAPFDAPSIQPSNSKPNAPPPGNKPAMTGGGTIEIPRAIDVPKPVVQHDQHDHHNQRCAWPFEVRPTTMGLGVSRPSAESSRTLNPIESLTKLRPRYIYTHTDIFLILFWLDKLLFCIPAFRSNGTRATRTAFVDGWLFPSPTNVCRNNVSIW